MNSSLIPSITSLNTKHNIQIQWIYTNTYIYTPPLSLITLSVYAQDSSQDNVIAHNEVRSQQVVVPGHVLEIEICQLT